VTGVRNPAILALAPLAAAALAIPARRLASSLQPPHSVDRSHSVCSCSASCRWLPAVHSRALARWRPEGKAYRAYFIADFEWAMSVVSEVSKGDVPPKNPFMTGDTLHYYWLVICCRRSSMCAGRSLAIEPIILATTSCLICRLSRSSTSLSALHPEPGAALWALSPPCCFKLRRRTTAVRLLAAQVPLEVFRTLNIDAISKLEVGSLKIDGLHRVLLYQSQHATAWAVSLSALIVLMQARDKGRVGVNMFAGSCWQ